MLTGCRAPGRPPVVRQGDVDPLGEEHLLVALVLKLLLALLQRLPDLGGGGADPAPGVGAGLRRQRADLGARQGQRRLVPGVREPGCLELVQGLRAGDRRERGLVARSTSSAVKAVTSTGS